MLKVLVAGRVHEDGLDRLRRRDDVAFELLEAPDGAEVAKALPNVDALIIRTAQVTAEAIAQADKLRVVSRHGVGFDNIDVAALTNRGIPLTVVGDVNAVTVAEYALAAMLSLAKRLGQHDAAVRAGNWDFRETLASRELWQKTLLIAGFGRIGRELARRALAFDMNVAVYDPYVDAATIRDHACNSVPNLPTALSEADFVSLHLPLTAETRGMIGAQELTAMRPSACLINTARGGLVEETALDEALRAGEIAGAALDVFDQEPPTGNSPLLENERVLLSPHIAGLTEECARRMAVVCVDNALAVFDGTLNPALVVNKDVLTN